MCSRPAVSKSACLTGQHQSSCNTEWKKRQITGPVAWMVELKQFNSSISESKCAVTICIFPIFLRCPAQKCIVSEWSFWSGCAVSCTPSFRVRVREVERQPSHSGAPCPSLEQRSGCRVYIDYWGRNCEHKSGTHLIMKCNRKSAKSNTFNFHQVLHSSPAWRLEKQGLSTITMETP